MIDTQNRKKAADLIRDLRDGHITNDRFADSWPRNQEDRALKAIASRIWFCYSDLHEHTLTGKHAPSKEVFEFLSRCEAFLRTDLPYQWSRDNFIGIGGLGWLVPLSLGLLWPIDRWIKRRNAQKKAKLRNIGDMECWPFISRSDLSNSELAASMIKAV